MSPRAEPGRRTQHVLRAPRAILGGHKRPNRALPRRGGSRSALSRARARAFARWRRPARPTRSRPFARAAPPSCTRSPPCRSPISAVSSRIPEPQHRRVPSPRARPRGARGTRRTSTDACARSRRRSIASARSTPRPTRGARAWRARPRTDAASAATRGGGAPRRGAAIGTGTRGAATSPSRPFARPLDPATCLTGRRRGPRPTPPAFTTPPNRDPNATRTRPNNRTRSGVSSPSGARPRAAAAAAVGTSASSRRRARSRRRAIRPRRRPLPERRRRARRSRRRSRGTGSSRPRRPSGLRLGLGLRRSRSRSRRRRHRIRRRRRPRPRVRRRVRPRRANPERPRLRLR